MNARTMISAAGALAVVAGAMVPTAASAQSYRGYNNNYYGGSTYYDQCERDQRNGGTSGALVGAAIGAVAGSSIASNGARTEGGVLGGLLGAAIGAGVGRSNAACDSNYYSRDNGYSNYGYNNGYQNSGYGYQNSNYGYDYDRGYDRNSRDYRYDARYNRNGLDLQNCRMTTVPEGRYGTRRVQMCADRYGNYHIVD